MYGAAGAERDQVEPPPHLLVRLRQLDGYTWDETRPALHSSYDIWHVFGTKHNVKSRQSSLPSSPGVEAATSRRDSNSPSTSRKEEEGHAREGRTVGEAGPRVVARISVYSLRDERIYNICKTLVLNVDPNGVHFVHPVAITRLKPRPEDEGPVVVCIFEDAGENRLPYVVDYGPAWYHLDIRGGSLHRIPSKNFVAQSMSLQMFLDFAIGATECLEILHGQQIVHGEIRADAFHMDKDTGKVRLFNLGAGLRTFEHGLTSSGWSTMSEELGAKNKLSYMSPEQTGRMPIEPDSRTDIFSLGVLFWTILMSKPAFDGETPMDVLQAVLGQQLPLVSNTRLDIPEVVGRIIQKMTAKTVFDRYYSASGLQHDLVEIRRLLSTGDSAQIQNWKIATKDVSPYFILPKLLVGRAVEHDAIVKVVDEAFRQYRSRLKQESSSIHHLSRLSEGRTATFGSEDHSFDDENASLSDDFKRLPTSSGEVSGDHAIYKANSSKLRSPSNSHRNSVDSCGTGVQESDSRQPEKHLSMTSDEAAESRLSLASGPKLSTDSMESAIVHRKYGSVLAKGYCEVITIAGAAGVGKSRLIQSLQVEVRRRGYFASSNFHKTERTPLVPVLRLLSSLFQQFFSESDIDSGFHKILKRHVAPVWPVLHKVLGLPESLISPRLPVRGRSQSQKLFKGFNRAVELEVGRRDSTSSSSQSSLHDKTMGARSSQDFLRVGSSTKYLPSHNIFLDILRLFASHNSICLCLEDLHFADQESLELIAQIVSTEINVVVILSYRPEATSFGGLGQVFDTLMKDGSDKSSKVRVTRITLKPLCEEDILEYLATTLRRPKGDVYALGLVFQSKTKGNPFFMKEMLAACHRKKCIWYDYKEKGWVFDLDRIFKYFGMENNSGTTGDDLITSRLEELPVASRSILAYASMLGSSFSFRMIVLLLNGEFMAGNQGHEPRDSIESPPSHSERDCMAGLQAAIQALIILPSEDDDMFRFAHDRYLDASASLRTCDTTLMHSIVAQTLVKYYTLDHNFQAIAASSICESVDKIRSSVAQTRPFRNCLTHAARTACESGVRSVALKFYAACIALLQDNMWDDVSYEDTLRLYTEAAETYIYRGEYEDAKALLLSVSSNGRNAVDVAPSWILQSRLFAQEGNSTGAFEALQRCLVSLDVKVDHAPTFSTCDAEFKRLCQEMQNVDMDSIIKKATVEDSNLAAVGAVLVEATSAAFWSDTLTFYRTTLLMVDTHLLYGNFPQSGMGFLQLALIAATRHNMIKFASDCGDIALALIDKSKDPLTIGKGETIYSTFVGHFQRPLQQSIPQLEHALDFAVQAGDRISTILNFGLVSNLKFFTSMNLVELESFCIFGCQDIPNWELDTLGGTMIIAIKQACRALQGKTDIRNPAGVMSDGQHSSPLYKSWLHHTVKNSDRPLMFYESIEIAPLFLYGHFASAVDLGNSCLKQINAIWSARNTRFLMFFQALSLAGSVWIRVQEQLDPAYRAQSPQLSSDLNGTSFEAGLQEEIDGLARLMKFFKRRIEQWQVVNNVNYLAWSKILDAQIAEMENDPNGALRHWEDALDHASKHKFVFEEALANNLLGGYLLRKGSRRLAKIAFREAINLYCQMGAVGVAGHVENERQSLLRESTTKPFTADVATQADLDDNSRVFHGIANEDSPNLNPVVTRKVRTWQEDSAFVVTDAMPALHMMDLASLLKSSQVISSVLRVDQLLKTMCEIILQNCQGVASLAAIVIEESEAWVIAASGNPEDGAEAHNPSPQLKGSSLIVESVINYCTRFRETILLPDIILDTRFSNVNESWAARNPGSKSVVALPICYGDEGNPLLGVVYLDGQPNAFSPRNLEVLQLLVNQIGISFSNALTLKEVERVSAINRSMVDVQKQALSEALVAESKANIAKAEALRHAKLAEEAAQAKTTFLANISHELRTPLNGVIGNTDLLLDSRLEEHQAEMIDSIRVSADLLLSLINDILDFSKIEAHKMELNLTPFNANEMVREVIRSVPIDKRHPKTSKDLHVVQDINLPQVLLRGDALRLHQILGNLISNSMKFTERGTVTIGARVEWETDVAVHLTFWVEDTGIGIPPQQIHKLFKPFSQADASTARKYGGSGLGLSICKSLVESMDGTIKLDSTENVGTIVSFSLTLSKVDSRTVVDGDKTDHIPPSPSADFTATGFTNLSSLPLDQLRICVAEDNPINQKVALQFLEKLEFEDVDIYENGLVAVEGIRQKAQDGMPYHVVLMDVQMPVLDGHEATKLLRKDALAVVRGILVIALTASAVQGDREKCLASGMNDYLAKPVRLAVLKKKFGQYMQVR